MFLLFKYTLCIYFIILKSFILVVSNNGSGMYTSIEDILKWIFYIVARRASGHSPIHMHIVHSLWQFSRFESNQLPFPITRDI